MERVNTFLLFVFFLTFSTSSFAQQKLSLDDAIAHALRKNTQVRTAESQIRLQKANGWSSWANFLPNVSVSAGPSQNYFSPTLDFNNVRKLDDDGKPVLDANGQPIIEQQLTTTQKRQSTSYSASFTINHNLWDWGRNWYSMSQSRSNITAAEYSFAQTQLTTIQTVKQNYYNLVKLLEQRKVLEQSLAQTERQLENSENLFAVGSVAQGDVYSSQVSVGRNKINIINQDLLIESAKQTLNLSLGKDMNEAVDVETNISTQVDYTVSLGDMTGKALMASPQIKQGEENIKGSTYAVKVAKSNRYPQLSYNGRYSRGGNIQDRVWSEFNKHFNWNLSLNLSLPLFDGFQTKSGIQRAEVNKQLNELNYEDTKRNVKSNVKTFYLQLIAFQEKIKINETMVKSAEEDFRLADERYKIGSGTLIDLIVARSNLTSARYDLVSLQYDAKIAESQLMAAAGIMEEKYANISADNN